MVAKAFMLIAERCGREHGVPLPKRVLQIGSPDEGWGVELNPTGETLEHIDPFTAIVTWGGLPAGCIDPHGGILVAGECANEDALCEWLESDERET